MAVIEHAFLPELPRNQFKIKFKTSNDKGIRK